MDSTVNALIKSLAETIHILKPEHFVQAYNKSTENKIPSINNLLARLQHLGINRDEAFDLAEKYSKQLVDDVCPGYKIEQLL